MGTDKKFLLPNLINIMNTHTDIYCKILFITLHSYYFKNFI
jgi:hypothetical protein